MKRYLNILSMVLILSACSSTSGYKESISKNEVDVNKVTEADFIKVKPLSYNPATDKYVVEKEEYGRALLSESQHAFNDGLLMKSAVSEDPLRKATGYCYSKKVSSGLAILYGLYDKYKKHPAYWNQIGVCFLLNKEYRKATLYFNKALEQKNLYSPALNNLGVIYLLKGKDQKAMVAFQKAVYRNKGDVPFFNLANLYLRYNHSQDAFEMFLKLSKEYPTDVEILNGMATSLTFLGRYDEALACYERINKDSFERADISINYSLALYFKNQREKAREQFSLIDRTSLGANNSYYQEVAKLIGYKL